MKLRKDGKVISVTKTDRTQECKFYTEVHQMPIVIDEAGNEYVKVCQEGLADYPLYVCDGESWQHITELEARRQVILNDKDDHSPRAKKIEAYLNSDATNPAVIAALAYCADQHLAHGYCDLPDEFLCGEGGLF